MPSVTAVHGVLFALEDARRAVVDLLVVSRQFDDAAFGRQAPRRMAMPPRGLSAWFERPDHFLPGGFLRLRGLFGERPAGDGPRRAIHVLAFHQPLRDHRDAARLIHVRGHDTARPA